MLQEINSNRQIFQEEKTCKRFRKLCTVCIYNRWFICLSATPSTPQQGPLPLDSIGDWREERDVCLSAPPPPPVETLTFG